MLSCLAISLVERPPADPPKDLEFALTQATDRPTALWPLLVGEAVDDTLHHLGAESALAGEHLADRIDDVTGDLPLGDEAVGASGDGTPARGSAASD